MMSKDHEDSREEEAKKKRLKNIASEVPPECLEDPRFIKVLATSLLSEIATLELILKETDADIKKFKESVAKGLEKRKVLKELTQELTKKKNVLNTAYDALERESRYRSVEVETVKNRLDDATLREIADRAKFKKILEDYQETWQRYKAEYEERPLPKERQKACVALKRLRGELMMAEHKKDDLIAMLKQRKKIDAIRVRVSIVQIAGMTLQRWKDQNHIDHLNALASELKDKLKAYTSQLTQLEQEEERKKRAETEASIMPPPRLDFSFMRSLCNNFFKRTIMGINSTPDPDSISINTVMLEEMCNSTDNGDEAPENCLKIHESLNVEKEQSLDIPNSVSMIETNDPIASQMDPTAASDLANQSDIHNKLSKLRIEKQQRQESRPTDENDINESNDYETNEEEIHRRTVRWCEESQSKFAPFSVQRSNSFNEQREFSVDARGKSIWQNGPKATSIHGSDTKSLRQAEREKRHRNEATMEIDEEPNTESRTLKQHQSQEQRKRLSGEKLRESTAIAAAKTPSQGRKLQDPIATPVANTPTSIATVYETPLLNTPLPDDTAASQESKESEDNVELPIDEGCSRPKVRKVETVNYPLGQRPKDPMVAESRQRDILYSPQRYVPSCMSSNMSPRFGEALQETPQVSFCADDKGTPGFPSLSNWKNWSPPKSERSFASSISKICPNKMASDDKQDDHPKEQSQPSGFFGGFFSMKPSQNPRNIF